MRTGARLVLRLQHRRRMIAILVGMLGAATLQVEGDCPAREALANALDPIAALDASYTVRVWRSDAGRSRLELVAPDGGKLIDRVVASDDCGALAQVFAVMIETHFARLHTPPPPPPPPVVEEVEVVAPAPPPPARRRMLVSLAAAGGVDVGVDPGEATGFGQFDLGVARAEQGFVLRLGAAVGSTTEQRVMSDRVERRETSVRLGVGYRFERGDWWIQPGAGAALVLADVTALDLMGRPGVVRAAPAGEVSFAFARRVGGRWSLRAEAATRLFPLADRYLIDGVGEVGRSPRASVSAALGLQSDFDW
jgi:hypothetical protein